MVAVGQIWEYRRDPRDSWKVPDEFLYTRRAPFYCRMAWEIVAGEFRGNDLFWTAKVIRDEDSWLNTDRHTFRETVFENGERFRLIWDPASEAGAYCGKCGDFFPYANFDPNFQCWACKNGY